MSALFLWLAARGVEWSEVVANSRDANYGLVALGASLMVLAWAVSALRWRILLSRDASVPWSDTFSAVLIGFFGNLIFPLRLGDATRIGLISLKHRLNFGFTLATGVLDKLLDVITLVVLAGIVTTSIAAPEMAVRAIQSATAVAALAVATLVVLAVSRNGVVWLEAMLSKVVPKRFTGRLLMTAEMFVRGLQSLKDWRQMVKVGSLSLVVWGISIVGNTVYLAAFDLSVPWQGVVLLIVMTNLGGAVPSSPGGIGVQEWLTMITLSMWVADDSEAFAFAVTRHAFNLGVVADLGAAAVLREGVDFSTLQADAARLRAKDVSPG